MPDAKLLEIYLIETYLKKDTFAKSRTASMYLQVSVDIVDRKIFVLNK